MDIKTENGYLVVRIPLKQKDYDATDQEIGEVPNLIGIIAGRDYSISKLIALGYKDDIQEGMPIIMFDTEEELRDVCKKADIDIWTLPVCAYCSKPIRGCYGFGKKGNRCNSCEDEV